MKVHHIGYLVKKMEKAIKSFGELGYETEGEIVYDPFRKINICFMSKDGYRIELVSPAEPDSVVSDLIKRLKNTPYHICYESECFEQDVENLCANGYVCMGEPCEAPAIAGRRVVFLMNPSIGMIEVVELLPDK